jgi:hypothetical protein
MFFSGPASAAIVAAWPVVLAVIRGLDACFHQAVDQALTSENARWRQNGLLSIEKRRVGRTAGGQTPPSSAIVVAAVSVTKALG